MSQQLEVLTIDVLSTVVFVLNDVEHNQQPVDDRRSYADDLK